MKRENETSQIRSAEVAHFWANIQGSIYGKFNKGIFLLPKLKLSIMKTNIEQQKLKNHQHVFGSTLVFPGWMNN